MFDFLNNAVDATSDWVASAGAGAMSSMSQPAIVAAGSSLRDEYLTPSSLSPAEQLVAEMNATGLGDCGSSAQTTANVGHHASDAVRGVDRQVNMLSPWGILSEMIHGGLAGDDLEAEHERETAALDDVAAEGRHSGATDFWNGLKETPVVGDFMGKGADSLSRGVNKAGRTVAEVVGGWRLW